MSAEYAIYCHDNYANGFTAAWAAAKIPGPENCDLPPARYDAGDQTETLPLAGAESPHPGLLLYSRAVMERLVAEQPCVRLFYYHHQLALQNLAGLSGCILDMARSGAMITWQALTQEQAGELTDETDAPDLIRYTQGLDLWHWQLPDSRPINAFLATVPHQLVDRNRLAVQLETAPSAALLDTRRFAAHHHHCGACGKPIAHRTQGFAMPRHRHFCDLCKLSGHKTLFHDLQADY